MEGLFVVQLVGVTGLFIGLGFFISIVLRLRRTLGRIEATLASLERELEELTPRVSSALRELERTGEDIGVTSNAATALLNRINGRESSSPVLDGAVRFLPVLVLLARRIVPLLSSRGRKK